MTGEIFQLINGIPVITPEGLTVPELRKIWMDDTSENKELANSKLVFIYHMYNPKSVYRNVDAYEKEELLIRDIRLLFGIKEWLPSEDMIEPTEKYVKLIETSKIRYADSLKNELDKISRFLKSQTEIVNTKELKERNAIIKESKETLSSLTNAEESAKKDIQTLDSRIRGQVKINMFDLEEFGSQ